MYKTRDKSFLVLAVTSILLVDFHFISSTLLTQNTQIKTQTEGNQPNTKESNTPKAKCNQFFNIDLPFYFKSRYNRY